jgi:hypothetical protein
MDSSGLGGNGMGANGMGGAIGRNDALDIRRHPPFFKAEAARAG